MNEMALEDTELNDALMYRPLIGKQRPVNAIFALVFDR
jgi:hypothetical protein